ncbi:DUF2793 domain-containing protein [Ancylobacter dichloromethanicus]
MLDRTRMAPPAASVPGDRHIVAAGATGAWAGHEGEIALHDGGWRFLEPRAGWRAYVGAEARSLLFRRRRVARRPRDDALRRHRDAARGGGGGDPCGGLRCLDPAHSQPGDLPRRGQPHGGGGDRGERL